MHLLTIGVCPCGRRGTLIDGLCGFCDDASTGQLAHPKTTLTSTVNDLFAALVAELAAEEIAAPLAQRFTLASVAADLCRLAGEPVPAAVLAALDEPTHAAPHPPRETHREPDDDAGEDDSEFTEEYRHRADTIRRGLRIDADHAAD